MTSKIPRPEAGARFDGPEVLMLLRDYRQDFIRGARVPQLEELRARVARRRCRRYLGVGSHIRFLNLGDAAFLLVRSRSFVRSLIYASELSGEFIPAAESANGWAHWRIPAEEVLEMVEG